MKFSFPFACRAFIDFGIDGGNMGMAWKYGIMLLIFAVFQLAVGILSAHMASRTAVGFSAL